MTAETPDAGVAEEARRRTDASFLAALEQARRERAELRGEIEAKIKRYEQYGHAIAALVQATGGELREDERGLMPLAWRRLKGRYCPRIDWR